MLITNSLQLTNKERVSLETQVAEAFYTRISINISASKLLTWNFHALKVASEHLLLYEMIPVKK